MLAGGTAGVAMWSVAIPPDVSLSSESEASRRDDEVWEGVKSLRLRELVLWQIGKKTARIRGL
jgi:hypothetical protein